MFDAGCERVEEIHFIDALHFIDARSSISQYQYRQLVYVHFNELQVWYCDKLHVSV